VVAEDQNVERLCPLHLPEEIAGLLNAALLQIEGGDIDGKIALSGVELPHKRAWPTCSGCCGRDDVKGPLRIGSKVQTRGDLRVACGQMDQIVAEEPIGFEKDAKSDQILLTVAGDQATGIDDQASGWRNTTENAPSLLKATQLPPGTAAGLQRTQLASRKEKHDIVAAFCGGRRPARHGRRT